MPPADPPHDAAKVFGPRVIASCIPRFADTVQALHYTSGLAYGTLHAWAKGKRVPRLNELAVMAQKLGVDAVELLGGPRSLPLRQHPDWPSAAAAAGVALRRRLPDFAQAWALDQAGATCPPTAPDHLDGDYLLELAVFWFGRATDAEITRLEMATVNAQMIAVGSSARSAPVPTGSTTRGSTPDRTRNS